MGAMFSIDRASGCAVAGLSSKPPATCDPQKPPPKQLMNLTYNTGQKSTNTFDTSIQRNPQMGISPIHM